MKLAGWILLSQAEDCAAAPNFDIVAMRTNAQNL